MVFSRFLSVFCGGDVYIYSASIQTFSNYLDVFRIYLFENILNCTLLRVLMNIRDAKLLGGRKKWKVKKNLIDLNKNIVSVITHTLGTFSDHPVN